MSSIQEKNLDANVKKPATVSTHRILIVEDDPDTRSGLSIRLKHEGFEVFSTGEGHNVGSLVQKVKPHAILLDLGLPGASGMEVLTRLQEKQPQLPVIVVSAWEERIFEDDCLANGAAMFLQKPIGGERVIAALRSVLPGSF